MKTTTPRFLAAAFLGLIAALGRPTDAGASTLPGTSSAPQVLLNESLLVEGDNSTISDLTVPGAGELFLTLTDLQFPWSLPNVSLSVMEPNASVPGSELLGDLSNPGTVSFNVSQATTLFADVGWTTNPSQNSGLFNLTATFVAATPVPIPQHIILTVAGLLLLLGMTRLFARPGFPGRLTKLS